MDALIGSTGFVGGHLARQHDFGARFNSRTITEAGDEPFDTVVCAAAPGSMLEANRFPDRDRARLTSLMDSLSRIRARRFVLISTIAVLADFAAEDEGTSAFQTELPYGVNRRALEVFCSGRFEDCLIVRLPALFGAGLKKNFIFDILNPMPSLLSKAALESLRDELGSDLASLVTDLYALDAELGLLAIDRAALDASGRRSELDDAVSRLGLSSVRFTSPLSCFQYYDMRQLWADIEIGLAHGLDTLHLAPAPLAAGRVFERLTGRVMPETDARIHQEDMRTRHAALWAHDGCYMAEADEVLARLEGFHAAEGRGA